MTDSKKRKKTPDDKLSVEQITNELKTLWEEVMPHETKESDVFLRPHDNGDTLIVTLKLRYLASVRAVYPNTTLLEFNNSKDIRHLAVQLQHEQRKLRPSRVTYRTWSGNGPEWVGLHDAKQADSWLPTMGEAYLKSPVSILFFLLLFCLFLLR